MKPRKLRVGYPAAVLEACNDFVFNTSQQTNVLGEHSHVIRSSYARQKGRVLLRQRKTIGFGIYLDNAAGDHRAQPLAHVALVEPRVTSDFIGLGRWQFPHRVE